MFDEKDKLILEKLIENSAISLKKLQKKLDLPVSTIYDRILKMKKEGVIKRYTVVPDYSKIGIKTTAFVFVSFSPGHNVDQSFVGEQIAKVDKVEEVHLIGGEWDILVKLRGKNIESIGKVVMEKIRKISGVEKTLSLPSFKTIKE